MKKYFNFFIKNNKFRNFIFFLFISFLLWFFTQLAADYTYTVNIPVNYIDKNNNVLPDDYNKDTIKVVIKTSGYQLLKLKFQRKKLYIPENIINNKNTWKPLDEINRIKKLFDDNVQMTKIYPEKIEVINRNIERKKVVIVPKIIIKTKKGFSILGKSKIEPEQIYIFGKAKNLKNIDTIYTRPYKLNNISQNIKKELELEIPKSIKTTTKSINYNLKIDEIVEGEKNIEVKIINNKTNRSIVLFPKKVKLRFKYFKSDFDSIQNKNISIVFDANNISSKDTTAYLRLENSINKIFDTKISPNPINFLIQKK